MVTIETLIAVQERDIALFQGYRATLVAAGRPVADLERRIAMAEAAIRMLRAAR